MSKHLMQWELLLYELHSRLESDPALVQGSEALATVELIEKKLQTNCDAAAQYLFFVIAPICHFKPHLTDRLIVHALRPLYYAGIESEAAVVDWLSHFTELREPYVELTPIGRLWIENLKSNKLLIEAGLAAVVKVDAIR